MRTHETTAPETAMRDQRPFSVDDNPQTTYEMPQLRQDKERSDSSELSPKALHERPKSLVAWALLVTAILSSALLFAMDNTITADLQPAITTQFNNPQRLSWISVSFLLTAAGTNLLWGRLYGTFENKWLYLSANAVFQAGSALCGAAPGMNALIVGRALCGVGGIGVYIGVLSLLSALTTIAERPIYLAMCGVIWGLGTVAGPFIGGGFAASSATWRWGFYINLCIGGFFAPVYIFLIPRIDPSPGTPLRARFKVIDWIGAVLLMGTMIPLLIAIAFGGLIYPWSSGTVIALFVVAGVLFLALAAQQVFALGTTPERRLFPLDLLTSKEMLILFVEIASAGTVTFVPIFFLPLFYQLARGTTALQAGLHLLPFILLLVAMNMVNGVAMGMFGYYMPWFVFGSALVIATSAVLYTSTVNTSDSLIYGMTAVLGLGTGSYSQAAFSIASVLVPADQAALSISFISCGQISGAAIGVAIADAVFVNGAQSAVRQVLPSAERSTIQGLLLGVGDDFIQTVDPLTRARIVEGIVTSIDNVWIITLTGGVISLLLAFAMNRGKLNLSGVPTAM